MQRMLRCGVLAGALLTGGAGLARESKALHRAAERGGDPVLRKTNSIDEALASYAKALDEAVARDASRRASPRRAATP